MKNYNKYRSDWDLFLSWPISDINNQKVSMYNPVTNEFIERDLLNNERNRSLLFFYPADFSYVCPTELTKLNKLYGDFHAEWVELLVISRDSLYVHKKWIEVDSHLKNFKIKMISDKDAVLWKDLWLFNSATGEYQRSVLICSPKWKIAYLEVSNASIWRNVQELLRVVKALNYILRHPEKVCQEGWQDGDLWIEISAREEHIVVH
jgi:NADH-dependent peroxiredoxin subunit C